MNPDVDLAKVQAAIVKCFANDTSMDNLFRANIHRALYDVIDFNNTGRVTVAELEKTEKTYIGTKVEILVRKLLMMPKGAKLDLLLDGIEVDIKFSLTGKWMIPMEAFNELCLVISGNDVNNTYEVGLLRMTPDNLTTSENRDRKKGVTVKGRSNVLWLSRGKLNNNR